MVSEQSSPFTCRSVAIVVCAAALVASSPVAPAFSQGFEVGVVEGTVRDLSGAVVVRAAVTLTGPAAIGGERHSETDGRGAFRFAPLSPGAYEVVVSAPDLMPARRQVDLGLGAVATVDVVLRVPELEERVTISADAPTIDRRQPWLVSTIDMRMLQALPVPHVLSEALVLAPGLYNPTSVPGLVVAYGGVSGSNGLNVEGVDLTEPRHQAEWFPTGFNWIEQIQVVNGGAGPEYGGFTGAVASATLRSGGNRFDGLAEYWVTHQRWIGRNGSSLAGREIDSWWDASAQVGGPIARDRFWFFGGTEYHRRVERPIGYDGAIVSSERTPRAVLKLSAAPGDGIVINGHVQQNGSIVTAANAGPTTAADALDKVTRSGTAWNVRLAGTTRGRWLVQARSGGYVGRLDDLPLAGSIDGPFPVQERTSGLVSGNVGTYQLTRPAVVETGIDVTRAGTGAHELRGGAAVAWERSTIDRGYPGGAALGTTRGIPTTFATWPGERSRASGRRLSTWASDRWELGSRATVSAGARIDVLRAATPDLGTLMTIAPVSPRLGIAYTPDATGTWALKASWGRYHDALMLDRAATMDPTSSSQQVVYAIGSDGALTELSRSGGALSRAIDPDIRQSGMDHLEAGVEHELHPGLILQVRDIHRRVTNVMAVVDTGSTWTPITVEDFGPDGRRGTDDDGAAIAAYRATNPGGAFYLYTNPDGAYRRYHGIQAILTRRWSGRWQGQVSYTWSRTDATIGNGDFTNSGLNDAGERTFGLNPAVFVNPNGEINASGRSAYDLAEFKALGSYRVAWLGGFEVSGLLWRHGGNRWERINLYLNLPVPGDRQALRAEPRGSRVTPTVWNLDLRLEKAFRVRRGSVGVALDVFNVTNEGTPLLYLNQSGPQFGLVLTRNDPRMARLLVRARF